MKIRTSVCDSNGRKYAVKRYIYIKCNRTLSMTRGKKARAKTVLDAFLHTGETCSGTNRCTNWEKPLLYWMWGRYTLLKVWVLSIFLWLNSGCNEWGADKDMCGAGSFRCCCPGTVQPWSARPGGQRGRLAGNRPLVGSAWRLFSRWAPLRALGGLPRSPTAPFSFWLLVFLLFWGLQLGFCWSFHWAHQSSSTQEAGA